MDPNKGGFLIVTILQVPSVVCAVYVFLRSFQRTSPLRRVQNHLLMCLLIAATFTITIDLPNTQKYLWTGSVTIYTPWFCVFWNISFLFLPALNRSLMAFMAIQRHFLVFRPHFYRTRRSRLLFHYTPLVLIVLLTLPYLLVTNIFVSCPQLRFRYTSFMCGYTCSIIIRDLGTFYTWMYVFIPTVITIVGCILLPVRFISQKRQLQQVQWHRARKMIVQMSIIAGAYTLCWLPYTLVLQLGLNNVISLSSPDITRFLALAPYLTSLLTPFIVLHTIRGRIHPAIVERIKRRFFPQRQGMIRPATNFIAHQQHVTTPDKSTLTDRYKNRKT